MPSGIRIRPAKNGAGIVRNARIPTYGLVVSPRNVMGRRKSQKMVAVVTTTTPVRLIQLLDRCMSGDSQPLPRPFEGLIGMIAYGQLDRRPGRSTGDALAGPECGIQRIYIGIENHGIEVPHDDCHGG